MKFPETSLICGITREEILGNTRKVAEDLNFQVEDDRSNYLSSWGGIIAIQNSNVEEFLCRYFRNLDREFSMSDRSSEVIEPAFWIIGSGMRTPELYYAKPTLFVPVKGRVTAYSLDAALGIDLQVGQVCSFDNNEHFRLNGIGNDWNIVAVVRSGNLQHLS